jgi:threonine synthase
MDTVTDEEIADAMRLLARTEGIFAETAGGVTVAVLGKLAAAGRMDPSARTVAVISGNGLKTIDAVPGTPTFTVRPSLDDFEAVAGLAPAA